MTNTDDPCSTVEAVTNGATATTSNANTTRKSTTATATAATTAADVGEEKMGW